MSRPTTYLGDGLYAEMTPDPQMVRVYAFNGEETSNEVFFEAHMLSELKRFLEAQGWKV